MCKEWRESFEMFFSDMGRKPSRRHSIDRIDNNKGYQSGNCRWATAEEQANNKRTTRFLTIGGETKTIAQWASFSGVSKGTIWLRAEKGKTGADLICPPWRGVRKNGRSGHITHNGITDTIAGWSKRTGIGASTIAMRLTKYNWPTGRALNQEKRECR